MTQDPFTQIKGCMCLLTIGDTPATDASWGAEGSEL
jgi:hypothetical protein